MRGWKSAQIVVILDLRFVQFMYVIEYIEYFAKKVTVFTPKYAHVHRIIIFVH